MKLNFKNIKEKLHLFRFLKKKVVKKDLIDTSKLDKTKSYICNEVGTSKIALIIQELSSKKYKRVPKKQLATHTFILTCKKNEWYVWENHLKWGGIKEYTLAEYKKINKNSSKKAVLINQYDVDKDAMEYWKNNNPGYSVTNLFFIAGERLIGLNLPDTKGWVCSQSVLACCLGICTELDIQFDDGIPADFQEYFYNYR